MSNAIKFTPEDGSVAIRCHLSRNGGIDFIESDTGVGMTEEDIRKAFELFGQADSSLARRFEGTGLGLSLAKQLAETPGGSLLLISELGKGTAATTHFPATRMISRS